MLKTMTWKKWCLLLLLIGGTMIAYPVYNMSMRQYTLRQLKNNGGTISYRPAYLHFPSFIGLNSINLPDSFERDISEITLHTWSNDLGILAHLGDFSQVDQVTLNSPDDISPEVFHFWHDKPWTNRLILQGHSDFENTFEALNDSWFRHVELKNHHLTLTEAKALLQIHNLRSVHLVNLTTDTEAALHLKESNLNQITYAADTSLNTDQCLKNMAEFLQAYGAVDILHWNYIPKSLFYDTTPTSEMGIYTDGKHLALRLHLRTLTSQQVANLWKSIDTSQMKLLSLDLTTSAGYSERDVSQWPAEVVIKIKAVRIIGSTSTAIQIVLSDFEKFSNLESFEFLSSKKLVKLHALANFSQLKHLTIQSDYPLHDFASHLSNLPFLESIDTPHGFIALEELAQLLHKPNMSYVKCRPGKAHQPPPDFTDLAQLCAACGWSINQIHSDHKYTLERISQVIQQ